MASVTDEIRVLDDQAIACLEERLEYSNGRYVEKPPMGVESNHVAARLNSRLFAHIETNDLGICLTENCGYRIFADDPKRRRLPDGSFIRSGRLPGDKLPKGDSTIAPDLAYEVVSPNDSAIDLHERIKDLLEAGVRLLWEIVPDTKQVFVHRADGTMTKLGPGDELSGEDVVQDFAMPLAELFKRI